MFEDRLVNRGLHAEFPDFEAVYHLVIDAVDSYNEGWERSFKDQEMLKVRHLHVSRPSRSLSTITENIAQTYIAYICMNVAP